MGWIKTAKDKDGKEETWEYTPFFRWFNRTGNPVPGHSNMYSVEKVLQQKLFRQNDGRLYESKWIDVPLEEES